MDSQTRPQQTHQRPKVTADQNQQLRLQVAKKCSQIPSGKVMSYGALGASCNPPISGWVCGRVMATLTESTPWWRVVAKNGGLPISRRSPTQSATQRAILEAEGVEFDDHGHTKPAFFMI